MEIKTVDCALELEEIMNANQIVATGSQFWKRVMQEVHNKIMHNVMNEQMQRLVKEPDERPIVTAKQNTMPRLSWKEDALVIHAIPQMDLIKEDKSAISDLFINLDIALKCGLVVEKTSQNRTWYPLGPNMQDIRFDHPTHRQSVSHGIQLGGRAVHGPQSHLTVWQYRQYCP